MTETINTTRRWDRIKEGLKGLPKCIGHTTAGLFQCLGGVFSEKMAHKGFNNITRGIQHLYNTPTLLLRELNGAAMSLQDRIIHILTFANMEPTTGLGHVRKHTRDRALHTLQGAYNTINGLGLCIGDLIDTGINSGFDAAAGKGATGDGFVHKNGFISTAKHIPAKFVGDLKRTFLTEGLFAKNPKSWSVGHFSPTQVLSATEKLDRSIQDQQSAFQPTVPFEVITGGKKQATPAPAQAA